MPITNTDVVAESTYITDRGATTRGLWLGLLSGPVVYALYFIVGYLLAEATCQGTVLRIRAANLVWVIGGLTTLATLLTMIFLWLSYRRWRHHREAEDAVGDALAFMAFSGLLLNGLFALLIVVTGVAVFFIDNCQWIFVL
ncbi:MAG: hypothetical protein R2932_51200 [Caldilineaceae bacterium]